MRGLAILILAVFPALGCLAVAGPYYPDADIVWPTYLLVTKSYDPGLSCPALTAEIAKVQDDIGLLRRAQIRVEDALRNSIDTQNSAGRERDGALLNTAISRAGFIYSQGRDEIRESRRIAQLRLDHLQNLSGACKPQG